MKYLIGLYVLCFSLSSSARTCFIGDTGMANNGQGTIAKLLKSRCHEVFHLGDIIYPKGIQSADDPKFQTRFWKYYGDLATNGIPFYLSVGNHDYDGNENAWLGIANKYNNVYMPALYYRVDRDGICYLVMDTNNLDSAQGDYINRELMTMNSCRLKIATGHHPYWSSGPHGDTGSRKKFYEQHILGKFDVLITGHDHVMSYEGQSQGTHFFVSGAGASVTEVVKKRVYAEAILGILELEGSEFRFVNQSGDIRFRVNLSNP